MAPDDNADLQYLRSEGCQVRRCDAIETYDRRTIQADLQACDAVLLMAGAAANCRVAQLVRDLGLPLDLVAVMGPARQGELTALLQVGVDWVMHQGDPPALLAAVLRALRLRRHRVTDVAGPQHCIGPWSLEDQGWCLRHGDGAMLRLTVSERAILVCLFEAPGHVASHAMLNQALCEGWQHAYGRRPRDPKLRGIISRLRWRGLQAGLQPPVESLRGYGYVWEI
ncbi:MAG: helix-turn-helix domain-containing protein [Castellaniella sp.]|uniref:helix-turn-helix domain-containing protein n=1 Tax=Castellaniella sp. TaxID=1955812 RepID=UPI002A362D2B|nr:helix-turn-helix domain-containing protein [Castellaniella sp.]MDY0308550.1 helix-turn-helix domain-containing protein [Castellaniella sp.]